jgi:hypothetical protein
MRNSIITALFLICSITFAFGQNLSGAYLATSDDDNHLLLLADGYITHTHYSKNEYKNTQGGTYKIDKNTLLVKCEFDDKAPANVGSEHKFALQIESNKIIVDGVTFIKQQKNTQDLDGLWRITGRKNNDKMNTIPRGDRKTIKILIDGYFQWIAINPAEKGFYGTGGGKYVFKDNKYQENILFFSRDNSRVGAELNFDGKIDNDGWHHSGKSSKGDPIYEIWSRDK